MAKIITPKGPGALDHPSGPEIGTGQGGAPPQLDPGEVLSQGQVHRTRKERARRKERIGPQGPPQAEVDAEPDLRRGE